MTTTLFYSLVGLALFLLGFHALFTGQRLLTKILSLNVAGSGLFLLIISIAFAAGDRSDPVLQALVLTGIVVAVSATALALALAGRLQPAAGRTDDAGDAEKPQERPP